ncbi:MAG: electron transport complex subunit RsxE [Christensenellales bacterium]|jgi:electron transport complex protein RnfE
MSNLKVFKNGVFTENPTFRLVLGMCPTLAVTTNAINGIGMGVAATFVLVGSNLFVSLLRNFIPERVRIPAFVIIIAAFVSIVEMVMQAFTPSIYEALGIFIPLIVVNCIILARAETFASKNKPFASVIDGFGMGVGFTAALFMMGAVREIIGSGSLFGMDIFGSSYPDALIMIMAPGGFITLGLLMALVNKIGEKRGKAVAK